MKTWKNAEKIWKQNFQGVRPFRRYTIRGKYGSQTNLQSVPLVPYLASGARYRTGTTEVT